MSSGIRYFYLCLSFDQPSLTQNYEIGIAIDLSGQSDTSGVITTITGKTTYPTGTGAFWVGSLNLEDANLISF